MADGDTIALRIQVELGSGLMIREEWTLEDVPCPSPLINPPPFLRPRTRFYPKGSSIPTLVCDADGRDEQKVQDYVHGHLYFEDGKWQ